MSRIPRPTKEQLLEISRKTKELYNLSLEVAEAMRKHVPKKHRIARQISGIDNKITALLSEAEEYFWSELEEYAVEPLKGFYTNIDLELKEDEQEYTEEEEREIWQL